MKARELRKLADDLCRAFDNQSYTSEDIVEAFGNWAADDINTIAAKVLGSEITLSELQKILELAGRGQKFKPKGRGGKSVVTKWIERETKKTPSASAPVLWERICMDPPKGLGAFRDRSGAYSELEDVNGKTKVKYSSWAAMVCRHRYRTGNKLSLLSNDVVALTLTDEASTIEGSGANPCDRSRARNQPR